MRTPCSRSTAPVALLCILTGVPAVAQQVAVVTAADYDRAARFLPAVTTPLVSGGQVAATWMRDGRFYYRRRLTAGAEFVVVDPARRTTSPLFERARVAAALKSRFPRVILRKHLWDWVACRIGMDVSHWMPASWMSLQTLAPWLALNISSIRFLSPGR